MVYPTLTLLEELGQIAGTTEGSRKSYAITPAGSEVLAENRQAVETILGRFAASQSREPALPVMRAMENLRTALRLKFGSGKMSPEAVRQMVLQHAWSLSMWRQWCRLQSNAACMN